MSSIHGRWHRTKERLLSLGYAGWGAGQLESEIHQNSWLTVKAQPDLVFDTPPRTLGKVHGGYETRSPGLPAGHAGQHSNGLILVPNVSG